MLEQDTHAKDSATRAPEATAVSTPQLVELAVERLATLYDDQQKLFAYQLRGNRRTLMPLEQSITYTAITVLGAIRAKQNGWQGVVGDSDETTNALVSNVGKVGRRGDVGLILWADAHSGHKWHRKLLNAVDAAVRPANLAGMSTMELDWLLTGLSYTYQGIPDEKTRSMAEVVYRAVEANFNNATRLFSHCRVESGGASIRNQIANFADQIYSVYSLSTYYEVFGKRQALEIALKCARRLCELQGDMGQWWWHYHQRRGVVASCYPVFAVHQDGMAPMALLKVSDVSGEDFNMPLLRGLSWLFCNNEMRFPMVDWHNRVIWRDIEQAAPVVYLRYFTMALAQLGIPRAALWSGVLGRYIVNEEMRPYELGWLLYAFAGREPLNINLQARCDQNDK